MDCPSCGDDAAYVGALFVECPNAKCQFFSEEQFDLVHRSRFQKKLEEDIAKHRQYDPDEDTPPFPWKVPPVPSFPDLDTLYDNDDD